MEQERSHVFHITDLDLSSPATRELARKLSMDILFAPPSTLWGIRAVAFGGEEFEAGLSHYSLEVVGELLRDGPPMGMPLPEFQLFPYDLFLYRRARVIYHDEAVSIETLSKLNPFADPQTAYLEALWLPKQGGELLDRVKTISLHGLELAPAGRRLILGRKLLEGLKLLSTEERGAGRPRGTTKSQAKIAKERAEYEVRIEESYRQLRTTTASRQVTKTMVAEALNCGGTTSRGTDSRLTVFRAKLDRLGVDYADIVAKVESDLDKIIP